MGMNSDDVDDEPPHPATLGVSGSPIRRGHREPERAAAQDPWPGEALDPVMSMTDTALVLVDMQRGYADPDNVRGRWMRNQYPFAHEYFFRRMEEATHSLGRLLGHFRAHGLPIIHVTFGSARADRSDMLLFAHRSAPDWARSPRDLESFALGGDEHAIVPELAPKVGEPVFNKTSHSAFTTTPIEASLESQGVGRLVIGGWATNACVEMTARDAADRGYTTFLIEDACAAFTPATHEAALLNFSRLYGGVASVRDVIESAA